MRVLCFDYRAKALKRPGCDVGEALTHLDNVQIEVRRDFKESKHLVKHLTVLAAHHRPDEGRGESSTPGERGQP